MRGIIGYFGFDRADAVVRKRMAQWHHAGFAVRSFAFVRGTPPQQAEESIDLGHVLPLSRWRRLLPMLRAMRRLWARRRSLAGIELFAARNLDMLLLALFARWIARSSAPVIYEVLDVNFSCVAAGAQGMILRSLESWAIERVHLLVVSSPFYVDHYYREVLGYRGAWMLFENKLPKYVRRGRMDGASAVGVAPGGRWRVGWFGYLDDWRSWTALRELAAALPERVTIHVRGRANADFDLQRFLTQIRDLPNVIYGGPYCSPDDLAELYAMVDIVWSVDCTATSGNPLWLLTNALYEAGFFGKPVVTFAGNQAMARTVAERNCGWCLAAPLAPALRAFIERLTVEDYLEKCRVLKNTPEPTFVESDEIERIWALAMRKTPPPVAQRSVATLSRNQR
jgi:succinoglycan biosynthesis protein ExoL